MTPVTFQAITRLTRMHEDTIYFQRLTDVFTILLHAKSFYHLRIRAVYNLHPDMINAISISKSGIDIGLQPESRRFIFYY
jgi:hypothetical protein